MCLTLRRNEWGSRHRVLTTVNCTSESTKLKVKDLFKFFDSQPIGLEVYHVDPPNKNTFNDLENFSMFYNGRQYKHQNSTISFSTGLVEIPRGKQVETSFRFLTNGRNENHREFEFKLVYYQRRTAGFYMTKHVEYLKPELDLTKTYPQMVKFVNHRAADFVALQVRLKLMPDGTKNGLIHARVLNVRVKAVEKTAEVEDKAVKKNIIGNECHPIGPFPKGKLVCIESYGLCRLACRRHYDLGKFRQ